MIELAIVLLLLVLGVGLLIAGAFVIGGAGPALIVAGIALLLAGNLLRKGG